VTDAHGIPLAAKVTAANEQDFQQLLPLVSSIPPVGGKPGPQRRRPERLHGDRAYDSEGHRRVLRWLGIIPALARRGTERGSGLGMYRWVVERTLSWLHQYRRLRIRYERRGDIHQAFLHIGCLLTHYK
jgi:transposase